MTQLTSLPGVSGGPRLTAPHTSRQSRPHRPLKVLAVLPSLWPGGAEMQLVHLLLNLPASDYHCELVTLFTVPQQNALGERLAQAGLPWTDLGIAPALDQPMGAWHAVRNLWQARRRLQQHIKASRPDIVYSRLWYAGVAVGTLPRRRLEFVHVANEENSLHSHIDRGRAKRWLRRWVVGQADRWVAPTQGLHDQFVRLGTPAQRGRVIYNSTPLPAPAARRAPSSPLRVAAMGRLVPDKGFERLLAIAGRLRHTGVKFQLDVAGEGPERAVLERQARDLGLENTVRFLGYVAEPLAFLQERDVFVLTSHTEGFANVLVEAMACSLPTVAFDIDFGPRELVVHGETGYLVQDGDLDAFASCLQAIAQDPQGALRLGQAGRTRAEELFSVPQMAAAFGALFAEALGPQLRAGGD
ncbi:glycosyltransferase [Deinococcus sp. HMF7604]|uniref:glycosyltransferase n=1 Tax=Deinococcus betulae TaxID=2873312 RepID=UPI001CCC5E16|nr:glycosyltransferase [Deinococcus betulae]MBZ9749801.1 glycosyltransferase [Deinococcus betulae]